MNIGIDIDEVIAGFMDAVIARLDERYGIRITRADWTHQWLESDPRFTHIKEAFHAAFQDLVSGGGMRELAIYPGARESITRLAERHRIIIVTARGTRKDDSYKTAKQDTAHWLAKHRIPFHHLTFYHDKGPAVQDYSLDVFIEDHPVHIAQVEKMGIPILLMDQPYNRELKGPLITRVHDWKEIEKQVERIEKERRRD